MYSYMYDSLKITIPLKGNKALYFIKQNKNKVLFAKSLILISHNLQQRFIE